MYARKPEIPIQHVLSETMYSRMDQVKFIEDTL